MSKDIQVEYEDGHLQRKTTSDDIELFSNAADALSVNDAVYIAANGTVSKAIAYYPKACAIGLVFEVVDSTSCRVITSGLVSGE